MSASNKNRLILIEPVDSEEMMQLVNSGGEAKVSFFGNDGEYMMKKNGNKGYLFTAIKKQLSEDEILIKEQRTQQSLKELSGLLKV